MASYAVASGEQGAHAKTLVASTVDTVTFAYFTGKVEVYSDGAATLYFTVDGTTPTVGGAATHFMPAATSVKTVRVSRSYGSGMVVKLISGGTPLYDVSAG